MSFSFTNVVAGAPITAVGIKDIFDDLQEYVNGGAIVADMTGPFQKHHIMKGSFQPISNTFNFVSGIVGGQIFTTVEERLSFLAKTPTEPSGGNTRRRFYPTTSMTFYVEKECSAFFQFFACPLIFDYGESTTVANERNANINVSIDGVTYLDAKCFTTEEWYASETKMRLREFFNGFQMVKLQPGWHSIGLEGFTNAQSIMLINWGFTLETWADDRDIHVSPNPQ